MCVCGRAKGFRCRGVNTEEGTDPFSEASGECVSAHKGAAWKWPSCTNLLGGLAGVCVCVCGVVVMMEPLTKELLFCFLKELAGPCRSGNINTFTLKLES